MTFEKYLAISTGFSLPPNNGPSLLGSPKVDREAEEAILRGLRASRSPSRANSPQLEPKAAPPPTDEEWVEPYNFQEFKNKWYTGPQFSSWRAAAEELRRQKLLVGKALRNWKNTEMRWGFKTWGENVGRFPFSRDPRQFMCRLGLFMVTCQVVVPEEREMREAPERRILGSTRYPLRGGVCDTPVPEVTHTRQRTNPNSLSL